MDNQERRMTFRELCRAYEEHKKQIAAKVNQANRILEMKKESITLDKTDLEGIIEEALKKKDEHWFYQSCKRLACLEVFKGEYIEI